LLEYLQKIDTEIFLFLNGLHSEFWDTVMFRATNQVSWIPFFAIIIYALFKFYKKDAWWQIVGIVLVILLSDQLVSGFMKPFFGRIRPSHDPALIGLVHLVNDYRGGMFSFASSHAANSFGISFFLWLCAREKFSWVWIMFVWAVIFSYTRIYLGVHYPADIVVGALVGGIIALFIDWIIRIVRSRRNALS